MSIQFAWHSHHNILVEPLTEPIEVRQDYIRKYKPPEEQEVRLRLLRHVQGQLPALPVEVGRAYSEAWRVYEAVRRVYAGARQGLVGLRWGASGLR